VRIAIVLIIIGFLSTISLAQGAEISANSKTIQSGQSTELKWKVKNAQKVLISGVGKVGPEGSQTITPGKTTNYTLIAEGDFGIVSETVTVEVTGAKGGDYPMDYDSFRYPLDCKYKDSSFIDFLDRIHNVLQDEMHFSVYGPFPTRSGTFMFVTDYKRLDTQPCAPNEDHIGERHLSYLVEVQKNAALNQEYAFTIKAFYQYRKQIERTWRTGDCSDIYKSEIEGLRTKINSSKK
jgi:hypothetical protein